MSVLLVPLVTAFHVYAIFGSYSYENQQEILNYSGVTSNAIKTSGNPGSTTTTIKCASDNAENIAPHWPFRGIVNAGLWRFDVGYVLQYRDTETGCVSEIQLGGSMGYCISQPLATEEHVELDAFTSDMTTRVILRIPWGDEAYPQMSLSERVVDYSGSDPYFRSVSLGEEEIKVELVEGRFRVLASGAEGYYGNSFFGLYPEGGSAAEWPQHPSDDWARPVVQMIGTDNFHYGLHVIFAEPACPERAGFIIAGDTGEVVACWRSNHGGGALLIVPEGAPTLVDRVALPQPVTSRQCDQPLDISTLRTPQHSEETT
ncbi:MAG: hypothetical protein OXI96_06130 [Acidimicrobiaceae bacterium]|nr:hypothetical protein [Acidimicrobiaceae bacterium]